MSAADRAPQKPSEKTLNLAETAYEDQLYTYSDELEVISKEVLTLESRVAELQVERTQLQKDLWHQRSVIIEAKKRAEDGYSRGVADTETKVKKAEAERDAIKLINEALEEHHKNQTQDWVESCEELKAERDEARAQLAAARAIIKEPEPTDGFSIGLKSLKKRLDAALGEAKT